MFKCSINYIKIAPILPGIGTDDGRFGITLIYETSAYQCKRRPVMNDTEGASDGTVTVEKGRVQVMSVLTILFFIALIAVSLWTLVGLFRTGDLDVPTIALCVGFLAISVPVLGWEVADNLPTRFDLTPQGARLTVAGRVRQQVEFDQSVKVDAILRSDRVGPRAKAFDATCAGDGCDDEAGEFLLLFGITISRDGRSAIVIAHDDGWKLVDIARIWGPLLDATVEKDMIMGDDMWRYMEFQGSIGPKEVVEEHDIFDMIRAIEH